MDIQSRDVKRNIFCCGCLTYNRKMVFAENTTNYQCLLDIINEIPGHQSVQLCWECKALLNKYSKFKQQVRFSYSILTKYLKQDTSENQIKCISKLDKHHLFDICIDPNENSNEAFIVHKQETMRIIKEEIVIEEVPLKTEIEEDNTSITSDFNNEDDKVLVEFCRKKKKKSKHNGNMKKKKHKTVKQIYKELELSKEELEGERRLALNKEEFVNAMFKCEKCIVSFPNVDDLNDHISIKHNTPASHKCDVCECTFNSEMSYNYHANRHIKRYSCVTCRDMFRSKRAACKHYEIMHNECVDFKYNTMERVETVEESTQSDSAMFICPSCDKVFRWKTSLRKHLETHRIETGEKRKPYCEPCRLFFTTTSNLQKHVKTSSKHQIQLKLRKLKMEESTPEKQEACIEQIKCSVNSSREQFPCPQCDKKFQWRGNLLRHLQSHAARANGELVCEPCKRTFSSIATYKQHMKISKKHVSENDFKFMCSECGKRFANKTRLRDHIDWEHLKNYVHTCSLCQKVFKSHTSLYLHKQVVHKKDNAEHLCDHCGKAFPNHAKLRSHITALHTSEAPYKCGSCAARFSWHSCLSRHVRRVHRAKRKHTDS